jgi:Tol biopolymer transport system component
MAGAASDQGSPTWSADGRQLVFGDIEVADPQDHFIRLLDLRSGKVTKLPGSAELRTARWSPDGSHIAAIRFRQAQLSLFDTTTQKWTDVAGGVTGDTLNWSRDSRYIYFDSPFEPAAGIYRYDMQTHRVTRALAYGPFRRNPAVMNDVSGFSLAPDGSILFRGSAQSSRLYLVQLQH